MSENSSTTNLISTSRTKVKKRSKKIKDPQINILYTNADCLNNKRLEFEASLKKNNIDIALICETLPKNSTFSNCFESYIIEGYDTIEQEGEL